MRQLYSPPRSKPSNVLGISVSHTFIETTFAQYISMAFVYQKQNYVK